jgi:uncharacterized membrane protein YfcA
VSEEQRKRRRKAAGTTPDGRAAETPAEGLGVDEPTASDIEVPAPATDVVAVAPSAVARTGGLLHKVHLDPAIGLGLFVPGLFIMAVGGALTWHWIFNIGSGVMMLGMVHFVAAVLLTALQQRSERKALAAPAPAAAAIPARAKPERSTPAATSTPAET